MSKTQVLLASLVAAVPGAFLAYLMVMSFISYGDKSSGAMKGLAGVTLCLAAVMCALPVIVWVAGPKTPSSQAADESRGKKDEEGEAEPDGQDDVAAESGEVEAASDELASVDDESLDVFEDVDKDGSSPSSRNV
jgi:hypothetical protein